MKAEDVTATLDLALKASGLDQAISITCIASPYCLGQHAIVIMFEIHDHHDGIAADCLCLPWLSVADSPTNVPAQGSR
jgi:hypothetical protein